MRIAIVTGASSGLGREFARRISREYGREVDEIWLIARRGKRLVKLARSLNVPTKIIPVDLTDSKSFVKIQETLREESPDVRFLVNCAGFGKIGYTDTISIEDTEKMIKLNCLALVKTTHIVLPFMEHKGEIIQLSSVSAFAPLPMLNVYAATKAFVLRYARALHVELAPVGIKVTAVCPYWIKDTEFLTIANGPDSKGVIKHYPFAANKKAVVSAALIASKLNLPVCLTDFMGIIQSISAKVLPECVSIALWNLLRKI